ncbi:MAG TPA: TIGR03619 family F420-dependent LLM class oxidoreductase [Acidimicrobiales bacterium]
MTYDRHEEHSMQFGVVVPTHGAWGDPGMIRAGIQAAEDLGYDTVWFGDHIVMPGYAAALMAPNWFDPVSCMLVGAGATRRIRFGSDVLVAPYRHPVVLSQLLAGADQLCGGRLTLGLGVGYVSGEFAALGAPYADRGGVTDEYIAVMKTLWESSGPVSFSGRWINFEGVHAAPPPLQRPFPVWVGGNGPAGRRRAAALGTGWHPLFPTPEAYASGKEDIAAKRAAAGATDPFTWSISTALVKVVLDGPAPGGFSGYAGQEDIPAEFGYAPAPPADGSGRLRFVGTPDEITADIEAYRDAGVEQFTLRVWVGDEGFGVDEFVAELERFATHVRPGVS